MSFLDPARFLDATSSDSSVVAIDSRLFSDVLRKAMHSVGFSEEKYLERYADVKLAVEGGQIQSGLDHFVTFGYFEGRDAVAVVVDEDFYLSAYPDVRACVDNGTIPSAQYHFEKWGRDEGRLAYEGYLAPDSTTAETDDIASGTAAPSPAFEEWWEATGPVKTVQALQEVIPQARTEFAPVVFDRIKHFVRMPARKSSAKARALKIVTAAAS